MISVGFGPSVASHDRTRTSAGRSSKTSPACPSTGRSSRPSDRSLGDRDAIPEELGPSDRAEPASRPTKRPSEVMAVRRHTDGELGDG